MCKYRCATADCTSCSSFYPKLTFDMLSMSFSHLTSGRYEKIPPLILLHVKDKNNTKKCEKTNQVLYTLDRFDSFSALRNERPQYL